MADSPDQDAVEAPGTGGTVATAGGAAAVAAPPGRFKRVAGSPLTFLFLAPALILLGALVVYPIGYTIGRSLFSANGGSFRGLGNYVDTLTTGATRTALKNNLIWVIVVPSVVTAIGLVLAVLSERINWVTAFKVAVFMPMAISGLAAGVIFRLVYQEDPSQGVANAVVTGVHDAFGKSSAYPGARPRPQGYVGSKGTFTTQQTFRPGAVAQIGLVGIPPTDLADARPAAVPAASSAGITGVVWLDFSSGGGGSTGQVDASEKAMSGVKVQAVSGGEVVGAATSDKSGRFTMSGVTDAVQLRLPASNFKEPFNGVTWLGPTLVTWSIIASYIWIWAGFAMVLIAAGLAAIPRDALEAARVDGGTEWQVFRKVTVPLLGPVLIVVITTLTINVLKVFDLVLIVAPGDTQDDANVLALEMWRKSFGGGADQGAGSALGVILFLLVLPFMILQVRRFRREQL